MRLSHNFEIPSISNEKPSISIEVPSISIENLGFPEISKYKVFHNLVAGTKKIIMSLGCFCLLQMFGLDCN